MQVSKKPQNYWWLHVFPAIILIIGLGIAYPYWEYRPLWRRYILYGIYWQWLAYILLSVYSLRELFKKLFQKQTKLSSIEIWTLSVFLGVTAIWIGYRIGSYTSYILGAVSFSVVFYLLVLFFFIRRNRGKLIFEEPVKSSRKKIDDREIHSLTRQLQQLMQEEKPYKNEVLKIGDLANKLQVTQHYLSQFLNEHFGKNFTSYINEYRIDEAKQMILSNETYTLEAIGYECGFKSKSTFFTTFKRMTGVTPAVYKKNHQ
jgi:AraC-like DNA-binding protein